MPGSIESKGSPLLSPTNHRITSPARNRYNCIAWAAGSTERWWWPHTSGYWPVGVPRKQTVSAFEAAFEALGYAPCDDGQLEPGFEEIALFAEVRGASHPVPTHAARQLANGRWTSKLGAREDIEHRRADDLCGPAYGSVVRCIRRAIPAKSVEEIPPDG